MFAIRSVMNPQGSLLLLNGVRLLMMTALNLQMAGENLRKIGVKKYICVLGLSDGLAEVVP